MITWKEKTIYNLLIEISGCSDEKLKVFVFISNLLYSISATYLVSSLWFSDYAD